MAEVACLQTGSSWVVRASAKKKKQFAARRLKQWALTFRGGRFWCCLAPKVWLPQTLWVMMTVQSCPSVPWSLFTSKFCSLELRQDGVQDHRWRRSVVFCDKLSRQCFCCWSVTGWLSYIFHMQLSIMCAGGLWGPLKLSLNYLQ